MLLSLIVGMCLCCDMTFAKEASVPVQNGPITTQHMSTEDLNNMIEAFNKVDEQIPVVELIDGETMLVRTYVSEQGVPVIMRESIQNPMLRAGSNRHRREYIIDAYRFNIEVITREEVVSTSRTDVEVIDVNVEMNTEGLIGTYDTSHSYGMSSGQAWALVNFDMSLPWDDRYVDAYCSFRVSGYMDIEWTTISWND